MNRFIAIVVFVILGVPFMAYSQNCTIKFDYSVEKEEGVYSLTLKNENTSGSFEVKLYDLNNGKIIDTKTLQFSSGEEKLSFLNIVPGRYAIYIKDNNCNISRTLGGPTGIDLTSE
ncbi:hypothetical protein [uncultured Marivirga sp.]|uniref:hypothetical protein n=1 Tax=uncultured Marivirga sp. TaxID=1123707 RepID=UPI0030EE74F3